ncbi:anti-sigma factor [Paenibacillus sp. UNC499MF]|uniref:anti-sigma factor family protein n=1 Tax=Paenibacillus sp. UNC499MF TaxID=1502751 RepID=UPI0008A09372|nr:zf-HC2 domain-containing protein [Paenibacillus sp. UNC499MF]SEF48117.1 Putative zinc-finger [Paenibacillus sp. UNC499MF]
MNCKEVKELMQRDLDGDLNDLERQRLNQHVQQCSECGTMLQRLRMLSKELENLPKIMPPFSIVDSILPQLERLDEEKSNHREEAAGLSRAVGRSPRSPEQLPWTRRIAAHVSWKTVSGVVAAGFVLGFFAFNMDRPAQSGPAGMFSALTGTKTENTEPVAKSVQPTTTADANGSLQQGGGTPTQPPASQSPGDSKSAAKPQADSNGEGNQTDRSASAGDTGKGTDSGQQQKPGSDSPKEEGSRKEQPGTTSPPQQDKQSDASSNESKGAGGAGNPPADGGVSPGSGDTSGGTSGSGDGETGGKIATTDPEKKDTHSTFTAAGTDGASPDGKLNAKIEDRKLTIVKTDGSSVYVSAKQWKETDTLRLVGWNGNDEFIYEVSSGSTKQEYVVSLKTKQERAK